MELTLEHLQSEHLDPLPLFQPEEATLWHIDTSHPDVVADDHVNARLATATIWSLDEDRTYTLPVFREKYTWSDEAIPERLRYLATHLHGSDTAVTETCSVEVFTATAVRSLAGRTVW
ncbi:hypothetical protein DJ83_03205 [Halorubrum ezzemoulense]|uniref:Uncharacterized protein n=1 Tax=Halorubrum ezzemoulense TaxID=337243 RepID=A0A256J325_HALEZ|nr:hypothetical protein [Halorubrum ezzemoulense]OYR81756.1 hypothetical protein DJ72_10430 [Halorubrum distributum]MDB2226428.1 hypothetical protein [Halorubrum ezzemoulense]MDB2265853.1 hypothetical protein [Halorubrum ezzemoulense]MDB2272721.1 hypothetical protein [Halorubrum ezzemoulense]MDB2276043.1 hypothetical protein [Halorubrum ezzemoulense]